MCDKRRPNVLKNRHKDTLYITKLKPYDNIYKNTRCDQMYWLNQVRGYLSEHVGNVGGS